MGGWQGACKRIQDDSSRRWNTNHDSRRSNLYDKTARGGEATRSMNGNNIYVLIHSPLVGPLTWQLVADEMRQREIDVVVPTLVDSPDSGEPFWKQHAESVSQAIASVPKEMPLT